jgi:cell division protease FtsH
LLEWETIDMSHLDDIMAGRAPTAPKDWVPRSPNQGGGDGGSGSAPVTTQPAPTVA